MEVLKMLLKSEVAFVSKLADICPIKQSRAAMDKMGKVLNHRYRSQVTHKKLHVSDDYSTEYIIPKHLRRSKLVLYLHGGGYTLGGIDYARGFGAMLAARCGVAVCCLAYRLAPEHPFPAALTDAYSIYRYLLQNGYRAKDIVLCGESAGGGLAYALALKLKSEECSLPCAIAAISPWTDLTLSGKSYDENYDKDPSMTKKRLQSYVQWYADQTDSPYISPIFGDFTGLPPSLILVGGDEILLSDSVSLHEKLLSCGCKSTCHIEPGMWHVYPMYNITEADHAYNMIHSFLEDLENDET